MSLRPWPPTPRDAKHGNFATLTHYLPVTLFLIVISAVIAALTLAGKNTAPADALYMSSQQGEQTLEKLGRECNDMLEKQGYVLANGHIELGDGKADFEIDATGGGERHDDLPGDLQPDGGRGTQCDLEPCE